MAAEAYASAQGAERDTPDCLISLLRVDVWEKAWEQELSHSCSIREDNESRSNSELETCPEEELGANLEKEGLVLLTWSQGQFTSLLGSKCEATPAATAPAGLHHQLPQPAPGLLHQPGTMFSLCRPGPSPAK